MSDYTIRTIGDVVAYQYSNGIIELSACIETMAGRTVQRRKSYWFYSLGAAVLRFCDEYEIEVDYTDLTEEDFIYNEYEEEEA
jgi:hypothetical protein